MAGELRVFQGDDGTWPQLIRSKDISDPLNPVYTPWNLNNYTFHCQVRTDIADKQPVIAATISVVVTDAAEGKCDLVLSSEESANLSPGKYKYQLVSVRTADDYVLTLVSSTLTVSARTTVVP